MKISRLHTTALSIPIGKPFVSNHGGKKTSFGRFNPVLVRLISDEGLEAYGYAKAYNDQNIKSLKATIDDLEEVIVGQDISRPAEAWEKLWNATVHVGHHGYGIFAVAAIDSALWNLRAKAMGIPLCRLLGGHKEKVPVYANSWFRNWEIDALQRDAAELAQRGFRFLKMRMGDRPLDQELERLGAIKDAVGKDVGIMVDVNWGWTVPQAIQAGRELQRHGVYWLEDPVVSGDFDDIAQVAAALDMPVAAGESICTKYEFRTLLEKRAVDIPQIDLQYVGGVTEWMKVAAMAEAWHLPVASHTFHDFAVHLVGAAPNGLMVEYFPGLDMIYQEPLVVKDGFATISEKPGVGLELDMEAVSRYEMK